MPNVLILLIIVILVAILLTYSRPIGGGARSKTEARIISLLEKLVPNHPFDQAHPSWLHDERGVILELDGYNRDLKVAVEVQGPGHIKPLASDGPAPYKKYYTRVARDKLKRKLCKEHGVSLITVDYRISAQNLPLYLRSRLFDIGIIRDRPPGYIYAYDMRADETY